MALCYCTTSQKRPSSIGITLAGSQWSMSNQKLRDHHASRGGVVSVTDVRQPVPERHGERSHLPPAHDCSDRQARQTVRLSAIPQKTDCLNQRVPTIVPCFAHCTCDRHQRDRCPRSRDLRQIMEEKNYIPPSPQPRHIPGRTSF